ncbi:MAG: Holliday junction resolvase RuvX [Ruminococcaceae bacterium]|nr:Holliday junction resolvase RuvX [Oscillospiraceae bacterium]
MIIMAIDYGDVRTGIAVCDKFEMLASPVCVITERNTEKLINEISELAKQHKAELFVVGLPKNMDSSIGSRAEKCAEFAENLSKHTGIDFVMRDERLSTVSAHNALNTTNTRGKKRKNVVDQVAAVMILQDYIDFRKNQGI